MLTTGRPRCRLPPGSRLPRGYVQNATRTPDWRNAIADGRLEGVMTSSGYFDADLAVLAIGHSARDTYGMLAGSPHLVWVSPHGQLLIAAGMSTDELVRAGYEFARERGLRISGHIRIREFIHHRLVGLNGGVIRAFFLARPPDIELRARGIFAVGRGANDRVSPLGTADRMVRRNGPRTTGAVRMPMVCVVTGSMAITEELSAAFVPPVEFP